MWSKDGDLGLGCARLSCRFILVQGRNASRSMRREREWTLLFEGRLRGFMRLRLWGLWW
jgi:hypothetical protein